MTCALLIRYLTGAALVAIILSTAAWFMRFEFDSSPYYYDEADYMYAVSRGFAANWTDTPAFSALDLVRAGLSRGRDPHQRANVSEWIRESGDMNGYRHWHGPLYYYLLIASDAPARSEGSVHKLALFIVALGVAVACFGALWIFPGQLAPAFLAASLFGFEPAILVTTELAPHTLFGVLSLAALFCAARLFQSGARRHWYAALVLAGAAFCTMELAVALVLALLICGWLERRRLQPDWPFAARSVLAFLAPVALLWPAGLYKLTFLKSYLAMAYLAVFRKGAWGDITFAGTWANRLAFSPVAWLLIAAALALYFVRPQLPGRRASLPFLIFGLAMLCAVLRVNAPGPRYTVPLIIPFLIFAACVLGNALGSFALPGRAAAFAALAGLLIWEANAHTRHSPYPTFQRAVDLLAAVRNRGLEDKAVLAPWLDIPTLHYYFPQAKLRGYLDLASIPTELAAHRFDAIMYPGNPVEIRAVPR